MESSDIQLFADTFDGEVPAHHRIGVEGTLHRISLIVHPTRSLMVRLSPTPPTSRRVVLVASMCAEHSIRSMPYHRVRNDSRFRWLHAGKTR